TDRLGGVPDTTGVATVRPTPAGGGRRRPHRAGGPATHPDSLARHRLAHRDDRHTAPPQRPHPGRGAEQRCVAPTRRLSMDHPALVRASPTVVSAPASSAGLRPLAPV